MRESLIPTGYDTETNVEPEARKGFSRKPFMDIFTSKENPEDSFDEMKLRIYRRCSSTPVFGDWWDGVSYSRAEAVD